MSSTKSKPAQTGSIGEWLPIDSLKPWAKNPRRNEEAIGPVARSIKRFGFGAPIVARKATMEIIAGHTRWQAARKIKMETVPVRILDISEADAQLLALADNKLGEISDWDNAQLAQVLEDLQAASVDVLESGFGKHDIDALIAELHAGDHETVEEDPVPEVPKVATSELGKIYQLGEHRLLCGDSTDPKNLARLVGEDKVALLWTDPPYNVDYEGKAGKIENDQMSPQQFAEFLDRAMQAVDSVLPQGSAFYIAHADTEGLNFRAAVRAAGWKLASCIIWLKNSLVMGRGDYHWIHEPILYGWKPGAPHHAVKDRKQTTVWECNRPTSSGEHPTMKPPLLIERAIKNSTEPGAVVLDTFGGSGSTLIAAIRTGRRALLCELDPKYCDVIRARYERFIAKASGIAPEAK